MRDNLAAGRSRLELLERRGIRLPVEEGHLAALRLGHDRAEWVAVDRLRELGAGADDDADVEAEALVDDLRHLLRDPSRRPLAGEHDVPALHVRPDALEAHCRERLTQDGHGDAVARDEVDASEQDDQARHDGIVRADAGAPTCPS